MTEATLSRHEKFRLPSIGSRKEKEELVSRVERLTNSKQYKQQRYAAWNCSLRSGRRRRRRRGLALLLGRLFLGGLLLGRVSRRLLGGVGRRFLCRGRLFLGGLRLRRRRGGGSGFSLVGCARGEKPGGRQDGDAIDE